MWFAADILYKGTHIERPDVPELWEESIILVEAIDADDAAEIAKSIAISEKVEYRSAEGDLVQWEFDEILSINELLCEQFTSGTEVFSRFLRTSQVESLKHSFED